MISRDIKWKRKPLKFRCFEMETATLVLLARSLAELGFQKYFLIGQGSIKNRKDLKVSVTLGLTFEVKAPGTYF